MPREDIEFKTVDNVTLRGWLYKPDNTGGELPCLVICHGYTCLKEMCLDVLAERFVSALPINCLVYDHRGFGASDQRPDQPRSEIIASQQTSDLQDAISYAQSREDVDANKIGLWGYSFSGGHALCVGASDRRVKSIISLAPFTDGDIVTRNLRPDVTATVYAMFQQGMYNERKGRQKLTGSDRLSRAAGNEPGRLPVVVANPLDLAGLPQKESYDFFTPWAEKVGWKNELTIKTCVSS